MKSKICGISDSKTLEYLVNYKYPPEFIGFIVNYTKSKRYVNPIDLKKLTSIEKKNSFYVAVLVDPNEVVLEEIKDLPFDYYQIYDCEPYKTKDIKEKYGKKIISAFTVESFDDIKKYKLYENIADIFLFDSKGYEKSISFNHSFLESFKFKKDIMIAGNIRIDDPLEKFSKIADIIDISGGVETAGVKDFSKIEFFLNKIKNVNNET